MKSAESGVNYTVMLLVSILVASSGGKRTLNLTLLNVFILTEGGLTVGAFRDVARIISRGKLRKSLCAVGCGVRSWELLK